ncbi:MAG: hypothetical protein R3F11_13085 [Verrucomicrobiales bacterium]
MNLIDKTRFASLWNVLVEESPAKSSNPDGCAMNISNGVSENLAVFLIACSNGEEDCCLAEKYKARSLTGSRIERGLCPGSAAEAD